jgi:hypothetical protein
MPNKNEIYDCRFCGGIDNFNPANFSAVLKCEKRHKNHSKESRAPTVEELDFYYSLAKQLRNKYNIYPNPETPRELKSNLAFAAYISAEGVQKFVSISEPEYFEGILQFEDYKLILGRDVANFDNITTQGYLSSSLLKSPNHNSENKFTHKVNTIDRWHDTEFKILEFLITQLLGPDNQKIKELIKKGNFEEIRKVTSTFDGVLKIFSERRVCESCANAIRLFKKIFPNIILDVIEGGGDHIDHGPNGIDFPKTQAEICKLRREIAGLVTPNINLKVGNLIIA